MVKMDPSSRLRWCMLLIVCAVVVVNGTALAYPPAVGILGPAKNCLACHVNDGPWKDDSALIIDILDKGTGQSLKQKDGTFLIAAHRREAKTVITVIGTAPDAQAVAPYRNAWIYVDPRRITDSTALDKFASGWDVNLPISCRLVGDASEKYPGASVTALPMTVRPGTDAKDTVVQLQVMLTRGEAVKGKAREGIVGNYFERMVQLRVLSDLPGATGTLDRNPGSPRQPKRGLQDFELLDARGKQFRLSDALRQATVVLWFTNLCPGCLASVPALNALESELEGQRVKIVAISLLGSDRQSVLAAAEQTSPAFPILIDPDGEVSERFTGVRSTTVCPAQNFFILNRAGDTVFESHFPGTDTGQIKAELNKARR